MPETKEVSLADRRAAAMRLARYVSMHVEALGGDVTEDADVEIDHVCTEPDTKACEAGFCECGELLLSDLIRVVGWVIEMDWQREGLSS